jgi:WD40 repeat protein
MRVFISYRRKTWAFTHRLAERLRDHLQDEVFVDLDSIDEDHFEQSILRNLRESDAFLLVISEETLDPERIHREEDWVRREIAEALRLELPIVLALVDGLPPPPPGELPEDIRDVVLRQGIEFYPHYFDEGVAKLADFLRRVVMPDGETPAALPALKSWRVWLPIAAVLGVAALLVGFLSLRSAFPPETTKETPVVATETPSSEPATPTVQASPTSEDSITTSPTLVPEPTPGAITADTVEQIVLESTLEGHTGIVWSLAWSPDGTMLASGGDNQQVIVWDPATARQSLTLDGGLSTVSVYSVGFSPDGTMLASAYANGSLVVSNAETGETLRVLGGHTLSWSADGTRIAAGGFNNTVLVWDADNEALLHTLVGHSGPVESVAVNADGTRVASGSEDGTLRVWDGNTQEQLHILRRDMNEVNSVAFSPRGMTLASGTADGRAIVWDSETGLLLRTMEAHTEPVESVAWSPDGRLLATGSHDGTAIIWNALTGEQLRVLEGHTTGVYSVAWSPDGRTLASGATNGEVILWGLNS